MDNSKTKENQFDLQEKIREEKVLSDLYQISSSELVYSERVKKTLEVGKTYFDLDLGIVSKIDGEEYIVKFIYQPPMWFSFDGYEILQGIVNYIRIISSHARF